MPKALKKMMDLRDTAEDNTMEFQQILQSVENSPEVRDVLGLMPRSPTVSLHSVCQLCVVSVSAAVHMQALCMWHVW